MYIWAASLASAAFDAGATVREHGGGGGGRGVGREAPLFQSFHCRSGISRGRLVRIFDIFGVVSVFVIKFIIFMFYFSGPGGGFPLLVTATGSRNRVVSVVVSLRWTGGRDRVDGKQRWGKRSWPFCLLLHSVLSGDFRDGAVRAPAATTAAAVFVLAAAVVAPTAATDAAERAGNGVYAGGSRAVEVAVSTLSVAAFEAAFR